MNPRSLLARAVAIAVALAAIAVAHAQDRNAAGIKVAVITNASGAHLDAYFNGLAQTVEAASVVLADPDGTAEEMARKALGVKLAAVYADRDELLAKEKPAMALVTMEARLAPEAIGAALDAGCHVLSEKPACLRAEDFAPLVEKAEASGLHLMLALANRSNPEVLKAREVIAAGGIGKLYGVEVRFVKDQGRLRSPAFRASWYADKTRAGGGHLTWLGIHWLDLAMFVTGSRVTQVAGFSGNVGGQPINIEDSVAMAMRFDNGAFGTLTSGYYLKDSSESLLRVWGSNGWLEINSGAPRQVRWLNTEAENPAVQVFEGPGDYVAYTAYVRACVRAGAGLEAPPITGRECLRVLEAVYGLYEAAETGKTVAVE